MQIQDEEERQQVPYEAALWGCMGDRGPQAVAYRALLDFANKVFSDHGHAHHLRILWGWFQPEARVE